AMNELDNHDHSRFLTRTSGFVDDERSTLDASPQEMASVNVNKGILKEATIIQMCMPGAPTIYYGDEAGLAGFTDPDDRRTYPWGREDAELVSFFKDAIAVHKEVSALRTGSFAVLSSGTLGTFAFGRWDRATRAVIAVNNRRDARKMTVSVEALGLVDGEKLSLELLSDREGHSRPRTEHLIADGAVVVDVPAFGGAVLVSRQGSRESEPVVTSRPRVKSVYPKDGSIARTGPAPVEIAIEFTEPMSQRSIAGAFSISPAAPGNFVWNGNRAIFVPARPLPPGSYSAKLEPSVSALRGGFRLDRGYEWSFSVE
ncbi:MAG: Ig-like domain-containing protein, partial [Spirochaetaceae bacterium]|nr:Ig-like domain-containing protein [Spirochaetaceae bacterium]